MEPPSPSTGFVHHLPHPSRYICSPVFPMPSKIPGTFLQAVSIFLVLGLVLAGPALADRKLLQVPTIAPPANATAPSPGNLSTAAGPAGTCTCLHVASSTAGPSYCYLQVQTSAGNTTSTDCVPPAGQGCTATEDFAGQVAQTVPIPGPVYKCNGENPSMP